MQDSRIPVGTCIAKDLSPKCPSKPDPELSIYLVGVWNPNEIIIPSYPTLVPQVATYPHPGLGSSSKGRMEHKGRTNKPVGSLPISCYIMLYFNLYTLLYIPIFADDIIH